MDLNNIKNKSDNFYSQALSITGWVIIIFGVLGSFVLGNLSAQYPSEFNVAVFFAGLLSTAVSGFLILGLSEIISILNDNRRLLAAMTQNTDNPSGTNAAAAIADELPEI